MKEMKTLTLGDIQYEVVDNYSRTNIEELNQTLTNLSNDMTIAQADLLNAVKTPNIGSVDQVLAIESVDATGKPVKYKAIDKPGKTAYEYALDGGYSGSESDFYRKLSTENPTKIEFDILSNRLKASDNTEFRFGVNEDGEYGYIIREDGADTVIPFSRTPSIVIMKTDYKNSTSTNAYESLCQLFLNKNQEQTNISYYKYTSITDASFGQNIQVYDLGELLWQTNNSNDLMCYVKLKPSKDCSISITTMNDEMIVTSTKEHLKNGETYTYYGSHAFCLLVY